MESFRNGSGKAVVEAMVATIQDNCAYLSEIDGAIGDGDHGINMSKGFSLCAEAMAGKPLAFTEALMVLGKTLLMDIGGSMGPLYGGFFKAMAKAGAGAVEIDASLFLKMLDAGIASVQNIGDAKLGDKTLLDTLIPARDGLKAALDGGRGFAAALDSMVAAAEAGMISTKDMVAKVGRAARLGERSRGVQDAGATSCFLLLKAMGLRMKGLLG
jgi:dihydroxyacetone kinase phosphoprotein-dependent L subunit